MLRARLLLPQQHDWLSRLSAMMTGETPFVIFRVLVATSLIATIIVTFPLWQVHDAPPMLPVLPLPVIDLGVLLIVSLVIVLIRPVHGIIIYSVLMLYAMLIDQFRLQPEIFSLTLLLWGTLPHPGTRHIARAHLIALWMWAGINKLLSPAFLHTTAQGLLHNIIRHPPPFIEDNAGYILALTELFTGLLILYPRTRKISAFMAVGLHGGILLTLSPLGRGWNEAVWPWNVALTFAGLVFVFTWRDGSLRDMVRQRVPAVIVVVLIVSPLGFYFGVVDAYMAHNLYSSNVARASSRAFSTGTSWDVFNVPTPPEHRIYRQIFRLTCEPGETMRITDQRWWFRQRDRQITEETCPETTEQRVTE